jgi:antitoxin (DNA-binding transcriptional repressor) of toxin-antitoxin stability system
VKIKEKTLSAAQSKAQRSRTLDDLESRASTILKRGRPAARVIPLSSRKNRELIGLMKGKIAIKGDIFSTGVKWNAQP